MKWVKRGLWTAAWSFWLWLGFGLYRELPRDLGPVVCKLPTGRDELLVGLLDTPPTAMTIAKPDGNQTIVRIRDLASGNVVREMKGPYSQTRLDQLPRWLFAEHRLLLTSAWLDRPMGTWSRYSVLDLETGIWRDLGVPARQYGRLPSLHRTKPLALFVDESDPQSMKVLDLRTGDCVFRWPAHGASGKTEQLESAFFVGEENVAVAVKGVDQAGAARGISNIELWSLTSPHLLIARQPNVGGMWPDATTNDGRMAWRPSVFFPNEIRIYDFKTNRFIFDNAIDRSDIMMSGMFIPPQPILLSHDGNICFDGMVRDLKAKEVVWKPKRPADVWYIPEFSFSDDQAWGFDRTEKVEAVDRGGWFQTRETWAACIKPWIRSATTFGIRDAWTGGLIYRTWKPLPIDGAGGIRYRLHQVSTARRWMVNGNGEVFRLPPPPNYPLLAFCQAILALPLVLLWVTLRWRRKRRLRMAGAAS